MKAAQKSLCFHFAVEEAGLLGTNCLDDEADEVEEPTMIWSPSRGTTLAVRLRSSSSSRRKP